MVKREKVTGAQGRRWVSGQVDSGTYFAEVRRVVRVQAQRTVAARLAGGGKPTRTLLPGR